jgi:hypothetical protein
MGFAKNIMGAGVPAAAAAADTIASVATGLTAAGTTQATALSLTADANFVSTVGASSGVQVYNGVIGDSCFIVNDGGANPLTVYPPTGGKFNNLATNAGFTLATNTPVWVIKITATRWFAILSA